MTRLPTPPNPYQPEPPQPHRTRSIQAGDIVVKARTPERAWRKLHRRIARDVLNGDPDQVSVLPEDVCAKVNRIRERGGLRLWLARRGIGI